MRDPPDSSHDCRGLVRLIAVWNSDPSNLLRWCGAPDFNFLEVSSMPMYLYETVGPDGRGGEMFEILQSIHSEPLTHHPETGQPVRRVVTAPHVPRKNIDGKISADLSDRNLDRLGFTKYVKSSKGTYEKATGSGPDLISPE